MSSRGFCSFDRPQNQNLKKNDKIDKYLDLTREKTEEHEGKNDTDFS